MNYFPQYVLLASLLGCFTVTHSLMSGFCCCFASHCTSYLGTLCRLQIDRGLSAVHIRLLSLVELTLLIDLASVNLYLSISFYFSFLSVPQICQTLSYLRAFVYAVPSAWTSLLTSFAWLAPSHPLGLSLAGPQNLN